MKEKIKNALEKLVALNLEEDYNTQEIERFLKLTTLLYSCDLITVEEYFSIREMVIAYAKRFNVLKNIR